MQVRKIELTNFRNYEKFKIEDLDNINIIIGNNGIGKTSILESIYVACTARTFKSNDEDVLINGGKEFFKIKIELENAGKIKKLDYTLTDKGKKTKINNNLKKKISDYIFQYKVILFSPDELRIIKSNIIDDILSKSSKNGDIQKANEEFCDILEKIDKVLYSI